jgi:two-component system NtrC family sensor kinase
MLAAAFNEMTVSLRRARQDLHDLTVNLERQVSERTAALAQAQAQLVQHEKLSSLGRLAASVAHEINNPLAGILTYTRLLIRMHEGGETDELMRDRSVHHLRLIQRETERCTAIVRNLLDFARRRPLNPGAIDLQGVVTEALGLVGNRLALQRIAVHTDFDAVPPDHADAGQVRQAVLNVVLNAADAMAEGGRLTLATRSAPEAGAVDLTVTDTGVGIPAEDLPRILDPFFTTKERGTGLGLSVVYGIVERHGGKLHIDSRVGQGTTITIRLPASPTDPDGRRPPIRVQAANAEPQGFGPGQPDAVEEP